MARYSLQGTALSHLILKAIPGGRVYHVHHLMNKKTKGLQIPSILITLKHRSGILP